MKPVSAITALFVLYAGSASAVELNKDALKTMQQEGHKIVEESQGGRSYKASNGQCLDISEGVLVTRPCNPNAKGQKWRLDSNSRLLTHDGRCVVNGQLRKCENAAQKWRLDGNKRLANAGNKCLQPQGSPPPAGARVVAADCGKSPHQVWK